MKNLILPIALGLMLLTACSKEESVTPIEPQMLDSVFVIDQNGGFDFEPMNVENSIQEVTTTDKESGTRFGFSEGLYQPSFRDPVILSWSGSTDSNGNYGVAELEIRKPSYTLHVKMQTACVVVDGNKAVYSGLITEVLEISGNAPVITENWRLYFQVTDNSSIRSIENKISNKWIFASPRSVSLCNVYPPSHRIWSTQGQADVVSPGYVDVTSF